MSEAELLEAAHRDLFRWFKGRCDCTTTRRGRVICTDAHHGSAAQFKEWLSSHWRQYPWTRPPQLEVDG